jgi:hypothetical protein
LEKSLKIDVVWEERKRKIWQKDKKTEEGEVETIERNQD